MAHPLQPRLFDHARKGRLVGKAPDALDQVAISRAVAGHPLAVHGINAEGLRRRGFGAERIARIRQMHRLLYRSGLTLEAARERIAELGSDDADVRALLDFLAGARRGIVR